ALHARALSEGVNRPARPAQGRAIDHGAQGRRADGRRVGRGNQGAACGQYRRGGAAARRREPVCRGAGDGKDPSAPGGWLAGQGGKVGGGPGAGRTDPTPQDIENARIRKEIADRQFAEYTEALKLVQETLGLGWMPWMQLVLIDSDHRRTGDSTPVVVA